MTEEATKPKQTTKNGDATMLHALIARVEELENQHAFASETIDNLNDIVTKQWAEIDRMKSKLKDMDDQVYALENANASPGKEPPPPHY